jgi:hypothetical protein
MGNRNVAWFSAGLVLGVILTLMAMMLMTVGVWDGWRCQRFSPITGECTVMQHKDHIEDE